MENKEFTSIAIDGPAGVGKSTAARMTAEKTGFTYIDTGALFRTIALYFIENGMGLDEESVAGGLPDINIDIKHIGGLQHMFLNGRDVTDPIRTGEVSNGASAVSVYGCVRDKVLSMEREFSESMDVIMDGRDIGTVVLPHARLKVFLTADSGVRAARRLGELAAKGMAQGQTLESIKKEIEERDERDSNRTIAPLKPAADAVIIDTSCLSAEEVADRILVELNGSKAC